jgi:hypothetical protein
MDESLQELENELVNLRPRRPSRALEARVEAALGEQPAASRPPIAADTPHPRFPIWSNWPLAAAAALVLLAATGVWRGLTAPRVAPQDSPAQAATGATAPAAPRAASGDTASAGHYRPVGAASVLYDLKDDGDVYLSDNTPARRVLYRYVDTYTWKNPATNASLKWSVPREEVRVLPASLH